jgi:hypothetical protein
MTRMFKDHPEFRPNISPKEMFKMGSFGGTYWRPIYSKITGKKYKNKHRLFKNWWKGIPENWLSSNAYDKTINKYKVKVGTSLRFWESKKWIKKIDPYGWVEWYCHFYKGRRSPDDVRQIKRWLNIAGPNGRFRKWLINMIKQKKSRKNDYSISPKIRQTLQHWAYAIDKPS